MTLAAALVEAVRPAHPRSREDGDGRWITAIGVAVGALSVLALAGALASPTPTPAASPWRQLCLLPVVIAAIRWGVRGGVSTAAAVVMIHAPFALAFVERAGPSSEVIDVLAGFVTALAVGGLTGGLASRVHRERARYETIVAIQRALADEPPIPIAAVRIRALLAQRFDALAVALVLRDGGRDLSSGPDALVESAEMASVLAGAGPQFLADTGAHIRPCRVLAVPVDSRERRIGALAIARLGELGAEQRVTIAALGAYIGLGLEASRLAARQRRFADELEEKVAAATRELVALDRTKSEFVATASHELRTPLTALSGFSELLVMRAFAPSEVRRLAGLMQREAARLVRLMDDLLDLSRLEQGLAPTLRRAAVDAKRALMSATDAFRSPRLAHCFVIDCGHGLPAVDADPDALDRILKNLIANAVKYSPPGPIRIAARLRANAIEFEVEDHGRGIPPDAIPRLFEPYFRVPDAAATARGAGIGLAVVKSLIEAHGGAIAVESEPSIGTRVRFTIGAVP